MRTVLGFVHVHPLAERSHAEHLPQLERTFLGGRDDGYWRLVSDLWDCRETFLLVEQSTEVNAEAVLMAEHCPCLWGVSPYWGPAKVDFTRALGFTRFRAELIEREPDLLTVVAGVDDSTQQTVPARHWARLDARLLSELTQRGYTPCVHEVRVLHHHVYMGICACGTDHEPFPVDLDGRYLPENRWA